MLQLFFITLTLSAYLYVFRKNKFILAIYFFVFFEQIPLLFSAVYLDTFKVYMFELGDYSSQTLGFTILTFLLLTNLFILHWISNRKYIVSYRNHPVKLTPLRLYLILASVLLVTLALLGHLLVSDIPLFTSGINKGNFWESGARFKVFAWIHNQFLVYVLLIGLINAYASLQYKESKIPQVNSITLAIMLIYLVLMGYKFGLLLQVLYLYFLPTMLQKIIGGQINWHGVFFKVVFVILLLFIIVGFVYMRRYEEFDLVFFVLEQRLFVMEGQVWNVVLNDFLAGKTYYAGSAMDLPLDYIMNAYMDSSMYQHYSEQNVRLSTIYPAVLFLIFDNVVAIYAVYILLALVTGLTGYMFIRHVIRFNVIFSILWMKMYFIARHLSDFDLDSAVNLSNSIWVIILLCAYLWIPIKKSLSATSY